MKLIAAMTVGLLLTGCEGVYAGDYGDRDDRGYDRAYGGQSTSVSTKSRASVRAGNGMTLYVFDRDEPGKSNCYNDCADSWPPFFAAAGATSPGKGLSIIQRADGSRQWAKDGRPLYFWIGDTQPGDTTGDGVGGVWHIAR